MNPQSPVFTDCTARRDHGRGADIEVTEGVRPEAKAAEVKGLRRHSISLLISRHLLCQLGGEGINQNFDFAHDTTK